MIFVHGKSVAGAKLPYGNVSPSICTSSFWSFRPVGTGQQPAMGLLPTADQQGKLHREEWRRLSSRAIAPRDGQAGTVHSCYVLAGGEICKIFAVAHWQGKYSTVCAAVVSLLF